MWTVYKNVSPDTCIGTGIVPTQEFMCSYLPFGDMTTSNSDYYWERIKDVHKFFFGSIALVFVAVAVFGNGPVASFAAFLFLAAVGIGPFAFIYYAYKDKQALATRHSDVNERHWLTIAVFMWLTSGIYAFAYTLIRAAKYDPVNPDQTRTGTQKLLTAGKSIVKQFSDDSESDSVRQSGSNGRTTTTTATSSHSSSSSRSSSASSSQSTQTPSTSSTGGRSASSSSSPSSGTPQADASSGSSSSQSDSSPAADSGSETNLYTSGDESSGNTQVYDPTGGSGEGASSAEPSQSSGDGSSSDPGTRFCAYCGVDLRPHGNPKYCPECGTETG